MHNFIFSEKQKLYNNKLKSFNIRNDSIKGSIHHGQQKVAVHGNSKWPNLEVSLLKFCHNSHWRQRANL